MTNTAASSPRIAPASPVVDGAQVAGIKTTLEAEPAPEEDAPATKPVAEAVGEVVDAAAGDDHKNPEAVAEAKAKITEEAEKAQREEAKKDEDEDKVPKYVLTK